MICLQFLFKALDNHNSTFLIKHLQDSIPKSKIVEVMLKRFSYVG